MRAVCVLSSRTSKYLCALRRGVPLTFLFRLQTWTTQEGRIRLSEDDGPAATEFLADDEVPEAVDHNHDEPSPGAGAVRK